MKHSWINAELAVPKGSEFVLCQLETGPRYMVLYYKDSIWWVFDYDLADVPCEFKVKYWQPIIPPEL